MARPARLVRGIVLSSRTRNYVLAARSFGASDLHVIASTSCPKSSAC